MTEELVKGRELLHGAEEKMWRDVEYNCYECGGTWITLEYLKQFHKEEFQGWSHEDWLRIQKTTVLNFRRTRDYPNDFSPVPQICPACNLDLSTRKLEGDLRTKKIEKDEEAGDYIKQISVLAPAGYEKVDIR